MATKLTDTGVEFPGNGTDPVEQSKAIKNVEGNEADSTGKITLSSVSGKTLDERLTEIEQLGSGGGAVYLEQNTFGTNNYMFKDSYWWGGESVYSYSSANATQQTAIENLERGNVLNLSSPNSSEYYHVSSVDSANKRITLIRGTFNDRSNQNLTIDDAENGTFSAVNLTHVSSVAPAVTTGSWLQIEAGSNYSGSTISTTNGIGFAPMNLSTLPSEATHILFRVTSETSGHLIIYNRENFLTRSSSAPILESEKVHQVDVESSGSQSSSDEFWVPNNSFLQFWLTGSGTAHLYPVAYAVMDLSKVNLDGASIPAVNALSDEIIDLQNQVNSNDADISILQTDVTNLESDVLVLQQGGGGGGDVALYAPPENLFLDTNLIDSLESSGNDWTYGPSNNQTYPNPTYTVSEFENFFTNHSDKYKLTLYSGDRYTEVLIEDLVSFFAPASNTSSTKKYYVYYDDTSTRDNEEWIEYKDNDLIFRALTPSTTVATHFRTYRIDMHLNAFGGGVTSLNNKTGDLTVSAGTGISVTSTSSPNGLQISNSGVTSVNSKTGGVNITAGTNISIDNSSANVVISSTTTDISQLNDSAGLLSSGGGGGSANGEVIEGISNTGNYGFGMLIGGTVFSGGPYDSTDHTVTKNAYNVGEYVNIVSTLDFNSIAPVSFIQGKVVKFDITNSGNGFALTENGDLYAWGRNGTGCCGAGHSLPIDLPVLVQSGVVDIYFPLSSTALTNSSIQEEYAYDVTIIKKEDGYLYGCGFNGYGTLGLGNNTNQSSFVKLTNFGTGIRFVGNTGTSRPSLIVQKTNYDIYVTGYNLYGHLGITAANSYNTPQLANGWKNGNKTIINKVECSTGGNVSINTLNYENSNFWILLSNNENIDNATEACIRVCGANANNSLLGFNNGGANISTPTTLQSFTGNSIPKDLMWHGGILGAGMWFDRSGNLYGWGYNSKGTLGNGTVTVQITPTLLTTGVTKMFKGIHPIDESEVIVVFISKSGTIYSTGWVNVSGNPLGRELTDTSADATWGRVKLPQSYSGTPKFMGGCAYSYTGTYIFPFLVDSNNNVFYINYLPKRLNLDYA